MRGGRFDSRAPIGLRRAAGATCIAALLGLPVHLRAQSSDPLPPATQLVAAAGAPAATEETFSIATSQDLTVTFTDFQTPAPLATASVVVTQGAAIAGMTTLSWPAASATLKLPAAVGEYTLRVIGTPNAGFGVGTFNVCVAPSASPSACIQSASLAGNITEQSAPANPTVSTVVATLTVTTQGSYVFSYQDDQFPAALQSPPNLALFQGSQQVAVPVPASPATITLNPGTYQLFAIAQADTTAKAGLYGVTVTPAAGGAPILAASYPVGLLQPVSSLDNQSAQSLTLAVTDFAFPSALAAASALVTAGGTVLATASSTGGSASFSAPQGALQVWSYGAAGTAAGTYEVDLKSASASLLQSAFGVNGGGAYAFAFISPKPLAAGSYQATANDFVLPAALSSFQIAVAQSRAILKQQSTAQSSSTTLDFTAAAAPVVLLVGATPGSGGSGLIDVNVETSAGSVVFDQVQPVSAAGGFASQPITLGSSGNFNVTLTDLDFPAAFSTLALVGSSAGTVLGKIYSGGSFPIAASPGNYQFTVVAFPGSQQQYGLYGIGIVNAPPTVTLTASPASVIAGGASTLSWTTANATSCTGSGGTFTGSQTTGTGSLAVSVAATTTYTLICVGPGGSASQSVTVNVTAVQSSSGGGGAVGYGAIAGLALLLVTRVRRTMSARRTMQPRRRAASAL